MDEVGSLKLGSETMYIKKSRSDPANSVIFSTLSGYVGRVTAITSQVYEKLKKCE